MAHVIDSVEDDKNFSKIYGGEYGKEGTMGVNLAVMRQPGSNTIEVTDNIKRLLPAFQAQLPPSVNLGIRGDRSKNIREAFNDIQFTMAATLALVIMVIFLFLRNFSATMIPAMALPFSIVGTFAVMYLLNFSLNNISMMALILSIGFVVDDAIVMLENIVRHIEMGETPHAGGAHRFARDRLHHRLHDAVAGRRLHPDSVHGRHPGPPVPRIRRHHLHRHPDLRHGVHQPDADAVQPLPARAQAARSTASSTAPWKASSTGMRDLYGATLHWVLRHRPVMLAMFVAVLLVTADLYMMVPKGFIPDTDNDNFTSTSKPRRAPPTTRW